MGDLRRGPFPKSVFVAPKRAARLYESLVTTGLNPLKPNDLYISRTSSLISRCCVLYIYSTNIHTEYFKHAAHSQFFSLQNAVYSTVLPFLVPVLFTF